MIKVKWKEPVKVILMASGVIILTPMIVAVGIPQILDLGLITGTTAVIGGVVAGTLTYGLDKLKFLK